MISYMRRQEAKWIVIGAVLGYLVCRFDGVSMALELVRSFL